MPRGRRGRPSGPTEEPTPEPSYTPDCTSVGHRAVVGGAAGRSSAHCVYGRLRQVLRGAHALVESEATAR